MQHPHPAPLLLITALLAGCIEALPLPEGFDAAEATEFAGLALSGYDMRAAIEDGEDFVPPEGFTLHALHTTQQNWNDITESDAETVPVGWLGTRDDTIYVIYRGTSTSTELLLDLASAQTDYPLLSGDGGGTHNGFTERYVELHPPVLEDVNELIAQGGFERIAVTGHSLGGAIATMSAASLAEDTGLPVTAYSYASPRVGDRDFAARYAALVPDSWRITNPRDLVPGYPEEAPAGVDEQTEQLYYEHVEVRVDLPFDDLQGVVETDLGIGGNHSSCRYLLETCELRDGDDDACEELMLSHRSCD